MNAILRKLFIPATNSPSANLALTVLRIWIGLEMFILHGLDKLQHFSDYAAAFPDPFGIGHTASLALSVFAEFFCSLLLVLGLITRWGALVLIINMAVAFFGAHGGALKGQGSGELAFVYLMAYVVIFIGGPGNCSLDKLIFGRKKVAGLGKD